LVFEWDGGHYFKKDEQIMLSLFSAIVINYINRFSIKGKMVASKCQSSCESYTYERQSKS
jgi:hypothetical protein